MEQAQCLISMRRQILRSHDFQAPVLYTFARSTADERALGDDYGAFMWPPRSYTCSFCTREFKSAQALGGHMNVHRRDRARLKQQSVTTQNPSCNQDPLISPSLMDTENSFQDRSSSSTQNLKLGCAGSSPRLNHTSFGGIGVQGQKQAKPEMKKKFQEAGSMCISHAQYDEHHGKIRTDLALGLTSVFCRNQATGSRRDDSVMSYKRVKTNDVRRLPFLVSNDSKKSSVEFEVLGGVVEQHSPKVKEDLDLELRLGVDPPKLK